MTCFLLKTKKALGGLFGLLGSFAALPALALLLPTALAGAFLFPTFLLSSTGFKLSFFAAPLPLAPFISRKTS
ncbi:hypothetical protein HanPSC8_Chr10g0415561 [Helianthus annuus]|nr:hypothetical protein HanPSC8_Chr10g0415561 [Helianthus annuus]